MAQIISTTDWPLMRLTCPEKVTDAELLQVEADSWKALRRREKFVQLLTCPRIIEVPDSRQRASIARMQREMRESLAIYCVADAMVLPSPLTRGVVTAINWITPVPHPQKVFADVEAAFAWVLEMAVRAGIAVNPAWRP